MDLVEIITKLDIMSKSLQDTIHKQNTHDIDIIVKLYQARSAIKEAHYTLKNLITREEVKQ